MREMARREDPDRATSWCCPAVLFTLGTRRRAVAEERAPHLHVGRAAVERGEPRAGGVLEACSWQPRRPGRWRSSRWSSQPPRWSSASRSSWRCTGAEDRRRRSSPRSRWLMDHLHRMTRAWRSGSIPTIPLAGARRSTSSSGAVSGLCGGWLARPSLWGSWFALSPSSSGSPRGAAEERAVSSICSTGSSGALQSRRRPPARFAVGGDDPCHHRRRAPDPRLRDRLHGTAIRATGASSRT